MATATSLCYLVDPVTGFAGEYRANDDTVLLLAPEAMKGQVLPAEIFVARNSDVQVLECEPSEFKQKSASLGDKGIALDFFLMLFDAEVQGSTKTLAIIELEKLFAYEDVRDHVLNIVYAAPLPASASYEFVHWDASGLKCLVDARQFVASQERIRNLYAVWAGMAKAPMFVEAEHERLTGLLIANSFFRNVVLHFTEASEEETSQLLTFDLSKTCDPIIIRQVLQSYAQTLQHHELPAKKIKAEYLPMRVAVSERALVGVAASSVGAAVEKIDKRRRLQFVEKLEARRVFSSAFLGDTLFTDALSGDDNNSTSSLAEALRAPQRFAFEYVQIDWGDLIGVRIGDNLLLVPGDYRTQIRTTIPAIGQHFWANNLVPPDVIITARHVVRSYNAFETDNAIVGYNLGCFVLNVPEDHEVDNHMLAPVVVGAGTPEANTHLHHNLFVQYGPLEIADLGGKNMGKEHVAESYLARVGQPESILDAIYTYSTNENFLISDLQQAPIVTVLFLESAYITPDQPQLVWSVPLRDGRNLEPLTSGTNIYSVIEYVSSISDCYVGEDLAGISPDDKEGNYMRNSILTTTIFVITL